MNRSFFSSVRPVRMSRRSVLRGALGAFIALPALEAMTDSRGFFYGAAQAATPPPVRLLTVFTPNGLGNGGDELTILQNIVASGPLQPLKSDITVVSGLDKDEMDLGRSFSNDAHDRGHGTFATGVSVDSAGAGGPSIDQVAAAQYGHLTRFRSMPIAIGVGNGAWVRTVSWSAKNTPVLPERDPLALFNRLFATGVPNQPTSPTNRQNILAVVKGDLNRLRTRVSTGDRVRVDQHLATLVDLEKELAAYASSCAVPTAPTGTTDGKSNERLQLLMRLLVVALQCDLTRYASVMICNRQDARQFPWIGVSAGGYVGTNFEQGHHGMSHDDSLAGRERLRKIAADHATQLGFMMNLMKAATEPNGSVLHNSVIMYGTESDSAGGHLWDRMTVLVGGHAGGQVAGGNEIKVPGMPYANLLCSMLNLAGVNRSTFGTYGTGRVPGL